MLALALLLLTKPGLGKAYHSQKNAEEPPQIGNFALPASQQPGPFSAFGQNIADKNQAQIYIEPSYLKATREHFLQTEQVFLYAFEDSFVALLTLPAAVSYRMGDRRSSGMSDISVEAEYAFYEHANDSYVGEATVVGELTVPSGSYRKEPMTGYGSPSYFLGSTYSYTSVDWYCFASPGMRWIVPKQNRRLGSQYYYQFGIGRNIRSRTNKYILFGLLELNGEYDSKDKINGSYDVDSGGNIVFITPSLMFSTEKLMVQLGVSLPLIQHLSGEQQKINYNAAAVLAWTFY